MERETQPLPKDRREIFSDIYRLYERYWNIPDVESAYVECIKEMAEINKKHGGTPLVKNLLLALYDSIDQENRIAREALRNV